MLLTIAFIFNLNSCKALNISESVKLQDVDFSKLQKLQVVTKDNVFNTNVSFSSEEGLYLELLDETPDALKNTKIIIQNGECVILNNTLSFENALDSFNNNFFPKILYYFFSEIDLKNDKLSINKNNGVSYIKKTVLEKTVIFSVELSLNNKSQSYILEIR